MHEDIRRVMDKLHAALFERVGILQEPAGEHRREHTGSFRVSGLTAPDLAGRAVDRVNVFLRPRIQIVDEGSNRVAVSVNTGDTADNAVTHNGSDIRRIIALAAEFIAAGLHAGNRIRDVFVRIHLNPARIRIPEGSRKTVGRNLCPAAVIDRDLDALSTGVKSEIKLSHNVLLKPLIEGREKLRGAGR